MVDMLQQSWAVAVVVFVAVALAVVCLSLVWEGIRALRRQRQVGRRLKELAGRSPDDERDRPPAAGMLSREEDGDPLWVRTLLTLLPRREDLRRLLDQADSDWSMGTFLLLTLGLAIAGGLATSVMYGNVGAPLAVAAGCALLPYARLRRRRKKNYEAFEENFPETIELLGRSLRAGHAFVTGLEVVAQEAPPPVNREFRQVFEEQRFGMPLKESLLGLADRVDTVDVRMFVTSVLIQRESGGNLAEVLDNLAQLIRERFKFRRQLRVYTAQGRMTGYLLAILPIAVGLALLGIDRDYMIVLFVEPMGRMLVLLTLLLQVAGFLWIRKIVNLDF
jgi:tight adherence protein B